MTRAFIKGHGNGFPNIGDYVSGNDGELYRVMSLDGSIQTGGWVRATVELADWGEVDDDPEPICSAVIEEEEEGVSVAPAPQLGANIGTIADEFARLAPDWLDDFKRYVGIEEEDSEEEDSEWHSVWALDDDGIGHRIISVHRDDIPALAARMAALPDGALNKKRLYRSMPLFAGLLVDTD